MKVLLPFAAAVLLAQATAVAQEKNGAGESLDRLHVPVAKKVAPATVYVRGGNQEGSGVLIDANGLVLTSPTACGTDTTTVLVVTHGSKHRRGRVVGRDNARELVLVKVDAPEPLPFVELGDSDQVKLGQVAYVFGDCFDSIVNDDQPAMSLGVVSGLYSVDDTRGGALYTGPVIETSAAVNPNQDGGPLVDRHGRLLGLVTLNYDEAKFTGLAVPVNVLKPSIEKIRKAVASGAKTPLVLADPPKRTDAWIGLEVRAVEGGLEVVRVSRNGPADKAGLRRGDLLKRIDGRAAGSADALESAVVARPAGQPLVLRFARAGETRDVDVVRDRRPTF